MFIGLQESCWVVCFYWLWELYFIEWMNYVVDYVYNIVEVIEYVIIFEVEVVLFRELDYFILDLYDVVILYQNFLKFFVL